MCFTKKKKKYYLKISSYVDPLFIIENGLRLILIMAKDQLIYQFDTNDNT